MNSTKVPVPGLAACTKRAGSPVHLMRSAIATDHDADVQQAPVAVLTPLDADVTASNALMQGEREVLAALPEPRRVVLDLTKLDLCPEDLCAIVLGIWRFLADRMSEHGLHGEAFLAVVGNECLLHAMQSKQFDRNFARVFVTHNGAAQEAIVHAVAALRCAGSAWLLPN